MSVSLITVYPITKNNTTVSVVLITEDGVVNIRPETLAGIRVKDGAGKGTISITLTGVKYPILVDVPETACTKVAKDILTHLFDANVASSYMEKKKRAADQITFTAPAPGA